jgi:hypothetical protein
MKVKGEVKQCLNGERDKFEPLNNLDQENINLEMQIKHMVLEIEQMEQKIKREENETNEKESELLEYLEIFTNVIQYSDKKDIVRRDYG